MAMLFELATSTVGLALNPILLAKLSCQFGARSISIITLTWIELLRFALSLHLIIFWRLAIWAIAVLSLPVRAFTALYRERLLETQLHRLRNELENALWDRKDLEEQLRVAIKERKMMETMLMELEEEHDEAIAKIELLEGEVQDLKSETQRLKEVQGKALWSYGGQADMESVCNNIEEIDNLGKSSSKPRYNSKNIRQVDKTLFKNEIYHVIKAGKYVTDMILHEGDILVGQREVAFSRSIFSAILSFIVGITLWEAKEPCMPLVVALFTVVIMSLMSVLRLFTRIENKPASDVIALLSVNWFILGTLTYPLIPRIARLLVPVVSRVLGTMFKLLGL